MLRKSDRVASLGFSLFGALVNFVIATQLLGAWRSFKWEPESEWEGSEYSISKNGISITWALLTAYFAAAFAICSFGVVGIVRVRILVMSLFNSSTKIPAFVRIYRDYIVGDFALGTILTAAWSYAAFQPAVLSNICEQLSRQPDLFRDFTDTSLSIENCDQWAAPGVMTFMAAMIMVTVVRLHFLIVLSSYYKALAKQQTLGLSRFGVSPPTDAQAIQHIYILQPSGDQSHSDDTSHMGDIYVPLTSVEDLSEEEANVLRSRATEIWIPSRNLSHSKSSDKRCEPMHGLNEKPV
ncbi:hypothetical protein BJ138DRAFT_1091488 [Hygrophoropsis aurantiaca]|uniref:Uncharacterized protein n=1 Tax=Hygrophoropsis aurantiaca TaxID=72124 RepID=A0ACB8A6M7_9AGAM|nr:hypothetical protein BJ138DRAFT_1091488 [Hygrophoropsis aurantiaca]